MLNRDKACTVTKYGYIAYTFSIHKHGSHDALPLGNIGTGQDSLVLLYGMLRGLGDKGIQSGNRYLRADSVEGSGRTVKFRVAVGQSGVTANILDPDDDDKLVFKRADHHIEASIRRGLLVTPTQSRSGLLILEVYGRAGAKSILCPALKRSFRHHTGLILDFAAVVDEEALRQYLEQAAIKGITLRRSGLPSDIADVVELAQNDTNVGNLELRITPGRIKAFRQNLVDKLRGDDRARRSLLQVGGLDFSDLSITMEVGQRKRTLTIDADRVPSFIYDLPGAAALSDDAFFKEALASVDEIARAVGVTVGASWQDTQWSPDALSTTLELPAEEPGDEQPDETTE
jgi:hypothetical protein